MKSGRGFDSLAYRRNGLGSPFGFETPHLRSAPLNSLPDTFKMRGKSERKQRAKQRAESPRERPEEQPEKKGVRPFKQ